MAYIGAKEDKTSGTKGRIKYNKQKRTKSRAVPNIYARLSTQARVSMEFESDKLASSQPCRAVTSGEGP